MEDRCADPAVWERFWPGKEVDFVCEAHADDTRAIAKALGFHIVLRELDVAKGCACSPGHVQRVNT